MDTSETRYKPKKMRWTYKNQLMLSEWLVEVPDDLESEWVMVKVPEGKRCLVVAGRGRTTAYLKNGRRLYGSFPSLLPGGNRHTDNDAHHMSTVSLLDCFYSEIDRRFYVIDVMVLGDTGFYECETDMRFSHAKTRLFEEAAGDVGAYSRYNPYPFVSLPHYGCGKAEFEAGLKAESFPKTLRLDGLLFYHKRVHYLPGATPLVGWLKGFMLPELLGVEDVPAEMMLGAPAEEKSQAKYIEDFAAERVKITEERVRIGKEKKKAADEKKELSVMNRNKKSEEGEAAMEESVKVDTIDQAGDATATMEEAASTEAIK
jgi:snurportin-1